MTIPTIRVGRRIMRPLLLISLTFRIGSLFAQDSSLSVAYHLIEKFDTTQRSPFWPHVDPVAFLANVKRNLQHPSSVYQGHETNFCGYSALTVLLCRDQPDVYVRHVFEIYEKGETTINGTHLKVSASVRETAGDLTGKGKLLINPADQLWLMSLPDHFKSYMNLDRKYQRGDENKIWAACTLGKFNRMAENLLGYQVNSKGTDLIRPNRSDLVRRLREELAKGSVVLYVNSKYLHPSKFRLFTLRAPTHYIILYDIHEKDGIIDIKYWDYGLKTVELMTEERLKKMTFGIITLTRP